MSLPRKFAAATAIAFMATAGMAGTATSASADDSTVNDSWYDGGDKGVDVHDNNVGPFQVCNNNVPTNVLGVQVPVSDIAAAFGFGVDGNATSSAKNCDQESLQDN